MFSFIVLSFNPYCSGCTAGSPAAPPTPTAPLPVSILIVVDVPLEEICTNIPENRWFGFNPYCSGCTAGRNITEERIAIQIKFQSLL